MKKRNYGIRTQRPRGGILRCEDCGRILAYLWDVNLSYAYLQLKCHCGGTGILSVGENQGISPNAMAEARDDGLFCPECGAVWLQKESGLCALGFQFVCRCGGAAETAHIPKRDIYRELKFT